MEVQDLSEGILAIGEEMVACSARCRAASCSSSTPPRCLWLEPDDSSEHGVIVLGLNPAPAKADEQRLYAAQEMSYAVTVDYLQAHHGSIQYFSRMRRLIRQMLGKTSILWTEVAKCELKTGYRNVPLSMQGVCASRYLKREVELAPKTWPVVAAGADAYRVAALLFSDRPVLGVPHPTGTYGRRFSGLLGADHAWAKQQFERLIRNGGAVWLSKGKMNLAAIELEEAGTE